MPRNDSKDPTLTSLDQIVFVTGANGGIGASMMHAYVQSGATVIGADRTHRGPDAAAYYHLDVTDEAATAAVIADVV
jgi:3-oxoacyl-[acyl-carrier protein] reductase